MFFSKLSQINHRAAKFCTYSHQNGFLKTDAMRLRAWREGAKKGTPDVFCRYPSQGKHGLYIEFKTPGRDATPEQKEFMREAIADGYEAKLVFSWVEAMDAWCSYVGIRVDVHV
jgi:hypothetical protein